MKYVPEKYHRRSIRMKGYDYSQTGVYFITICLQHKACLFGNIVDGSMVLNNAGLMVEQWYHELENKFSDIRCDKYVIMPNHFHCIVINNDGGEHTGSPLRAVVQWFKTMTTNEYIRGVKHNGWKRFDGKLWQRNYYEHIVRNEKELNRIRQYIMDNPAKWESDQENPL